MASRAFPRIPCPARNQRRPLPLRICPDFLKRRIFVGLATEPILRDPARHLARHIGCLQPFPVFDENRRAASYGGGNYREGLRPPGCSIRRAGRSRASSGTLATCNRAGPTLLPQRRRPCKPARYQDFRPQQGCLPFVPIGGQLSLKRVRKFSRAQILPCHHVPRRS